MTSIFSPTQPVLISDAPLLARLLISRVCAGFPSPAEDLGAQRIDLTQVLITHPQASYLLRVQGHSMMGAGIFDNDILVVNRAVKPRHKHIVVAVVDGEFTVKRPCTSWAGASSCRRPIRPFPTSFPMTARPSRSGAS